MNIVFMGTPEFAVPSLEILYNSRHKISAVVTVPDKQQGRGLKITESPVKKFAAANNLKVLQPVTLKDENFLKEIKSLNPDLIAVVAFRILPKEIFSISKYGSINLHASLLPKYRGAAPINWAIINGEKQTGVTTFFLKEKVDTGNIILQDKCEITDIDNAGILHDRLMELGKDTLLRTVDLLEEGNGVVSFVQQNEDNATPAPKIFRNDCKINWFQPSVNVYNFIRGISPYPGAFTILKDKVIKIYSTEKLLQNANSIPGKFNVVGDKILVSCSDFMLSLTELQAEGKKRMPPKEFLNGNSELFT